MSKFLDLIEENTPSLDDHRTPEENAKIHLTSILKNAGYEADYKTFSDEVVITFGDGTIATFEVKRVFKPEAEESDAVEDQEIDMKDLEQVDTALATAEKIKAASNPARPTRGVKKIEKSIGKLGDAVSKKMDMVSKSLK